MLRFHQKSVRKVKAAVDVFNREGFHVIREALNTSDLQAVVSDDGETAKRADESSGWGQHVFPHRRAGLR